MYLVLIKNLIALSYLGSSRQGRLNINFNESSLGYLLDTVLTKEAFAFSEYCSTAGVLITSNNSVILITNTGASIIAAIRSSMFILYVIKSKSQVLIGRTRTYSGVTGLHHPLPHHKRYTYSGVCCSSISYLCL